MLHNSRRCIVPYITNNDPSFLAGNGINIIGAGSGNQDQFQGVGRIQHFPVNYHLVGDNDIHIAYPLNGELPGRRSEGCPFHRVPV